MQGFIPLGAIDRLTLNFTEQTEPQSMRRVSFTADEYELEAVNGQTVRSFIRDLPEEACRDFTRGLAGAAVAAFELGKWGSSGTSMQNRWNELRENAVGVSCASSRAPVQCLGSCVQ